MIEKAPNLPPSSKQSLGPLSLDALQVVEEIATLGSFAAAARKLKKVPSALTYTVRQLEEQLDVLIFDRTGHKAVLTPAGRELLSQGQLLLQAAFDLSHRVKAVALGWETELRIAIDDLISMQRVLPLIKDFYAYRDSEKAGTQLRISKEILVGGWDALIDQRCDLAIGLPYEAPMQSLLQRRFSVRTLGTMEFTYCVSANHPLAKAREPLTAEQMGKHRASAVADTSRHITARTVGLLSGQDTLTFANLQDKINCQLAGIATGYIPAPFAKHYLKTGELIAKKVDESKVIAELHYAWATKPAPQTNGKALQWWLDKLEVPRVQKLLASGPIN
jgi:DNA-binding transcriptional LysR family regulator